MSTAGSQSRNPVKEISHPYNGVTFYKRTGRWEANIWYMGNQHYLGASFTALEAARAYDKGILLTRTDLGQLNFDRSDYETDRQEREQMTFLELRNHLRKTSRQPNCQIVNSKLKVLIDGDGKWEIKYRLMHPPTFKARHILVGWFHTEEEALIAYNNAAMLHDGHEATIRSFRSNHPQVAGSPRNPNLRLISQPVLRRRRSTSRKRRAPAVRTIVNQVLDDSPNVHVSTTKEVVSSVAHQLPSLSQLQSLKLLADLAEAYALAAHVPQAVMLNVGDHEGGELEMPDLVGTPRSPFLEQQGFPESSNSTTAALAASEMQGCTCQNPCQLQGELSAADLTVRMPLEETLWRTQMSSMECAVDDHRTQMRSMERAVDDHDIDSSQFSSSTISSTLPINIWSNHKEGSRTLGSDIETLSGSKTLEQLRRQGSFGIDDLDLRLSL